jgi:hypothetical protein
VAANPVASMASATAAKFAPKLVADQMGRTVDVNQNVYTQSRVEMRTPLVNQLEELVF